jgi:hypothetical protein
LVLLAAALDAQGLDVWCNLICLFLPFVCAFGVIPNARKLCCLLWLSGFRSHVRSSINFELLLYGIQWRSNLLLCV